MENLIGRTEEIELLNQYINSSKAEFIAVYGRRRIGKTYLIDQLFKSQYAFSFTGIIDGNKKMQFKAMSDAFEQYGLEIEKTPADWLDAFSLLRKFLSNKISEGKPCIIFIDELPCLDYKGSGLVEALGYFWNSWASKQDNIKLIVCGSATSWMISNIIDSRGGLHNRITHEIHLRPFCLGETREYLKSQNVGWDDMQYLQAYMILGGIPYYLSLINNRKNLSQNIDDLFFCQNGELRREFSRLFKTLFSSADSYMEIVKALASKKSGLTKTELSAKLGKANNGHLSEKLEDLINCDFVRFYNTKDKKITAKNGIYQLTDFYSIFYLTFINKNSVDSSFWTNNINNPELNTWYGLSFEKVAMTHISQIKRKLHIDYMSVEYYSWRGSDVQIDLILERKDRIIELCEIKYSNTKYAISKAEHDKLTNRISRFQESSAQGFAIWPVFITTQGLEDNMYSKQIMFQVTLEDLFVVI
ncbi:MAG: AAA family ATPase [Bacteroidales bacterium]|nr:AAA family ATPase [Bacteroidales bacterium]